jgi:PAS domain S-box-containing protein
MFRQNFRNSILYKFQKNISITLFVGACVLSFVVAVNEWVTLKNSLTTKGRSFASYIAKLSLDPLIMKDNIRLDSIVNEANKDEDILYAIIGDAQGNHITSQYASINYQSPRLKAILSRLSKDSEFQDVIDMIKKDGLIVEVSVPILTGADTIGIVTVCLSMHNIRNQIILTVLFVLVFNLMVAVALGSILFIASRKSILNPIIDLGHAAGRLAKGDLSTQVNIKTTGEIRMLVDSFNQMAEDLQKTTVSKDYVSNIIGSMNDALIVVSPEGRIINANRAIYRLLGYEEGELVGRPVEMIFGKELSATGGERDLSAMSVTGTDEKVYLTRDGRKIPVSFSVSAMNDADGKPLGIICIAQDITERKRAEAEKRSLEERLQRAEKLETLGKLAGGVAHDLNNVLGVISGYSELLIEKIPAGNPLREYTANILKSSERAAAIIQDLLTLTRRGVIVFDVIDFNSLVSNFLVTPEFDRLQAYHPNVTVKTDLEKDLLHIKGSHVHLEKMLMNLVSNAAEAIVGSGEVKIRTENRYLDKTVPGYDTIDKGDYVVLTVSDTGGGIPTADLDKIFEPFYTNKSMGRSGTGLGLAIVWGTIKDHAGYIAVKSIEGKGTTFTLYFPVTREESRKDTQKIPIEQYMGHGESVLVVDDVHEQRQVATTLLMRLGYKVNSVSSGEEAVEYLKSNNATILVLDMIMDPGIDGFETYKRILEINPHQKAIIVSGFSETERIRKAQELGAGVYMKKPYLMEKLGIAIRDELIR